MQALKCFLGAMGVIGFYSENCLGINLKLQSLADSRMNAHKRQTIENLIVNESGNDTLDLNDIVLGYEGARIVAAMVPQYHQAVRHVRLNGNNIDAEGFQLILAALLHCPHLKSLQAEWNNIGSSEIGLAALSHLIKSLQYLQLLDLKNNRIGHHLAGFIADIIEMNKIHLKVIDLRWNDIGQLGAKTILNSLPFNKHLKFIGLEDNRVSTGTLMEIESLLKMNAGAPDERKTMKYSSSQGGFMNYSHPISGDEYLGMDTQIHMGDIRAKIDNEQKQAQRYSEKLQVQIQKVVQKIKIRGAQCNQLQAKYDALQVENHRITSQLRQAERFLTIEREKALGIERSLNQQKSQMRSEKYRVNHNIQQIMQKYTQRNQRELEELELVMNQKLDRLNSYLKERLHEKRSNRDKLVDLKEDIMKFKINKEEVWNKGASHMSSVVNANINKGAWEEEYFSLEEMISRAKSTVQAESKKGDYMSQELNNQIIRALKKQKKLEQSIFNHQNKIKQIHKEMVARNIEGEKSTAKNRIYQSRIYDREVAIAMMKRYLKYIQSQNQISIQIEDMKQDQLTKANRVSDETISIRIADLERALRAQQAQNKMIKNQYEKMMAQLETMTKKNIQHVLFE